MPEFIDRNGNKMEVDAPGVIKLFVGDTPPEGHLVCNGGAISRAAYPELFAAIGTRYGAGDGTTTFNLPNTEDRFPRFAGGGLVVGEKQVDAIRNISGELSVRYIGDNQTIYGKSGAFYDLSAGPLANAAQAAGSHTTQGIGFSASLVVPTDDENRPKAIAMLACIRY